MPRLAGYPARQILRFLGQVAGRYFYMDAQEKLRAGWYEPGGSLTDYQQLQWAEYATAPIGRVLLRQTQNDVGWAFPEGENEANTLILQGNPIFASDSKAIAERLFRQFSTFSHTPFTCRLLPGQEVPPGCLVEFTDLDGVKRAGAVMGWEKHNGVLTVRGAGSYLLQSVEAFTELEKESLEGQVLSISRATQGLAVSHRDLQGNVGELKLSLAGLSSQVSQVDGLAAQTTALEQTAQGLQLQVSQLTGQLEDKTGREEFTQVTEHFRFDSDGLTIQNSATGMGIRVSEEQVAFLGGGEETTAIAPDAMETTRLTVGKRLDVGNFSLLPRTNGNLSLRYTGNS